MTFYESNFVETNSEEELAPGIKVIDFMCKHCNRIKISNDLVEKLAEYRKAMGKKFYIVLAYQCKELCMDIGEDINNSHTNGVAVDLGFGGTADLLEAVDAAAKIFPYVGLVQAITGEYYLHLQYAKNRLYWLCAKKEDDKKSEYVYFKNYNELRRFLINREDLFGGVKV